METVFVIKNFKRTRDCILTIKSIRHFCDNEIHVLNLFNQSIDEYKNSRELVYNKKLIEMGVVEHFWKTKYECGPGANSPANGLYYSEGINYCFEMFKDQNKKVIFLDENHFFTTGETIKFLLNNDYDFAYGTWGNPTIGSNEDDLMPNCSLLGVNFFNLRYLFPVKELIMFCEPLISSEVLTKISDTSRIIKIPTRASLNYFGDGFHTNDYYDMYFALKKSGII